MGHGGYLIDPSNIQFRPPFVPILPEWTTWPIVIVHQTILARIVSGIVCLYERPMGLSTEVREQIGTLILDEVHLGCIPSAVEAILAFSPKYVIALTATLERDDGNHEMVKLLTGCELAFVPPTRPYRLVSFQTDVRATEKMSMLGTLDYGALCGELAGSEDYNESIVNIVVNNPTRKYILLCKLVTHAQTLSDMINERGIKSDTMAGSKKTYADCKALVGTYSKISVGFDAATFCSDFDGVSPDCLILCATTKKWQTYTQSVGRVMRAKDGVVPIVVWMLSRNAITTRHLGGLKKYIQSTEGTIEKRVKPFHAPEPTEKTIEAEAAAYRL